MNVSLRRVVVSGALVVAAAASAGAQPAAPAAERRLREARASARVTAATPKGREWLQRHLTEIGSRVIPVLNACLPEDDDDNPTPFSAFLRLSAKGRVLEVLTDLDPSLGRCMTDGARELQLPPPPRDEYWVQLNLGASL